MREPSASPSIGLHKHLMKYLQIVNPTVPQHQIPVIRFMDWTPTLYSSPRRPTRATNLTENCFLSVRD